MTEDYEARMISNQGPTPVYFGEWIGDKLEVAFVLQPGEKREISKPLYATAQDGSGVLRLRESRK